jgi:tripartite-type tricarboxylate transporter receptor subunit TctC
MNKRVFYALAAALLSAAANPAEAQEPRGYPARSLRLIAPTPPGSPPDLVARVIGEKLALALGQPVVVDNRAGATGTIGIAVVAKSAPDGYTLAAIGMPPLVLAGLITPRPFDTERDLSPVALVAWNYNILAVPAASPVKSVAQLIAAAKARPGALRYSTAGNATPAHLATELLKREANVDVLHVPYKGAAAAVGAMLTGEADMMIGAVGALSPHIKSGRLRPLATSAPQRIAAYPELPTFVELGYPGVQLRDLQGIAAPVGTPRDVIDRLHAVIAKATATAEVKERLEALGIEAASAGPEQFAAHIRAELRTWGKVIRDAGIKVE